MDISETVADLNEESVNALSFSAIVARQRTQVNKSHRIGNSRKINRTHVFSGGAQVLFETFLHTRTVLFAKKAVKFSFYFDFGES